MLKKAYLSMEDSAKKPPTETWHYHFIAKISEYRLRQVWTAKFADKPFPNVTALILSDQEFLRTIQLQRTSSSLIKDMSEKEYGRPSKPENITAQVHKSGEGYVIIMRQHSIFTLDQILEHELRHIYKRETEIPP